MAPPRASAQPLVACRAAASGAASHSSRTGRTPSWRVLAAVAAVMVVATQLSSTAALCDSTPGVRMTARHYTQALTEMPDWSDMSNVDASSTAVGTDPSWPVSATDSFDITIDGIDYSSNVAVLYEGYIDIVSPVGDTRFFQINSTDGSLLYINDTLVLDNDGLHDYTGSPTKIWPLASSPARIKISVQYFKGPDPIGTGLAVSSGPLRGASPSPIPASEFMLNPCVDARVSFPPPVAMASPPPPIAKPKPPPHGTQGRDGPPTHRPTNRPPFKKSPTKNRNPHTHQPTRRTPKKTSRKSLPKACGGKCGKPVHKLPKACGGKCGEPVHKLPKACGGKCGKPFRTLPRACKGRCATMKPKKGL